MTMENWISQMGIGSKQLTERYAEYPAPAHDQHLYYQYEPSLPSHGHAISTKHHHSGASHKNNAAMSALTLLAFLFFLHILQQCLKEHMTAMTTPQVMVVSAGRDGEQRIAKISNKDKLDKAGVVNDGLLTGDVQPNNKIGNKLNDEDKTPFTKSSGDNVMMKIETAEYTPHKIQKIENKITSYTNRSSLFSGFVSAMERY